MDKKRKLYIWIIVDLVLLVLAFQAVTHYFNISATLKAPCVVCASENETIKLCIENLQQRNRVTTFYEINLSEIIKEKNNGS